MDVTPQTLAQKVDSEVGALRRALVHRPGRELERLTPRNREALLFDDLPWVSRAQTEHDAFCEALRREGVETLDVQVLLGRALDEAPARELVLERTLRGLGPALVAPLREWLEGLPGDELAAWCIGGVTYEDLPFHTTALAAQAAAGTDFVIGPLPNSYFTRDPSTWVGGGVVLSAMATSVRGREAVHHEAIYRYHPRFRADAPEVWAEEVAGTAAVEGGDLIVLGGRRLLVGCGDRTRAGTIESLAAELFDAGVLEEVVVVMLPHRSPSLHLDAVLAQVDVDAFVVYADLVASLPCFAIHPGRGSASPVKVTPVKDVFGAISRAVGVDFLRLFDTGDDALSSEREQASHGSNVLAVAPGRVIAYERNIRTIARLREAGIEVIEVAGSELGRGRGGPRCMCCPIERDPNG
jgi:arginine deiminase